MSKEEFVELTPRLFHGLYRAIERADAIDFYKTVSVQSMAVGQKISISLEEYLAIVFKEDVPSSFDDKTDDALEAHAQKQFEEMKRAHERQRVTTKD